MTNGFLPATTGWPTFRPSRPTAARLPVASTVCSRASGRAARWRRRWCSARRPMGRLATSRWPPARRAAAGDPAIRREDARGRARLGSSTPSSPRAWLIFGASNVPSYHRRGRASEHRRHQQRRQRSAGHGPARLGAYGIDFTRSSRRVNTVLRSQSGGAAVWMGARTRAEEGVVLGDTFNPRVQSLTGMGIRGSGSRPPPPGLPPGPARDLSSRGGR